MSIKFTREEILLIEEYSSVLMKNPCHNCDIRNKGNCFGSCHRAFMFIKESLGVFSRYKDVFYNDDKPKEKAEECLHAMINLARLRKEYDVIHYKLNEAEVKLEQLLGDDSNG